MQFTKEEKQILIGGLRKMRESAIAISFHIKAKQPTDYLRAIDKLERKLSCKRCETKDASNCCNLPKA